MGTLTERSFTPEQLKDQLGQLATPERLRQELRTASTSSVVHAAVLALAFSLAHVDLGYAAGAFLVIYGAKLLPIIINVRTK